MRSPDTSPESFDIEEELRRPLDDRFLRRNCDITDLVRNGYHCTHIFKSVEDIDYIAYLKQLKEQGYEWKLNYPGYALQIPGKPVAVWVKSKSN